MLQREGRQGDSETDRRSEEEINREGVNFAYVYVIFYSVFERKTGLGVDGEGRKGCSSCYLNKSTLIMHAFSQDYDMSVCFGQF